MVFVVNVNGFRVLSKGFLKFLCGFLVFLNININNINNDKNGNT